MQMAFLSYISVVSIILCIFMYVDKRRAIKHEWRIQEKTLFLLAILGGAIGGVVGMYAFRHKTKQNRFVFIFPLLAAIHVYLIVKVFQNQWM